MSGGFLNGGRRGCAWAVMEGAPAAFWSGLGLVLAMVVCAGFERRTGHAAALVHAGGATVGRVLGCLLDPRRILAGGPVPRRVRTGASAPGNAPSRDWWRGD